jgi:hypothetical protein
MERERGGNLIHPSIYYTAWVGGFNHFIGG